MPVKPSYLGLLNAVANAEWNAHEYLEAWIAVCRRDDVRGVLQTVSAREGEHGMAFAKRIDELGFAVRPKDDPKHAERLAAAAADCSDLEKMEALGLGRLDTGDQPDLFDDFFKDHSIDIRTGELLGRYIAEERDTARLLRHCYEQLVAETNGGGAGGDRLDRLEHKIDEVCRAVEDLRQVVSAAAPERNGRKPKAGKAAVPIDAS